MNYLKIVSKIMTLMGTTWVFGFLANVESLNFLRYPFIILNASQGLAIFIFFVLSKEVVLRYKKLLNITSKQNSEMNS